MLRRCRKWLAHAHGEGGWNSQSNQKKFHEHRNNMLPFTFPCSLGDHFQVLVVPLPCYHLSYPAPSVSLPPFAITFWAALVSNLQIHLLLLASALEFLAFPTTAFKSMPKTFQDLDFFVSWTIPHVSHLCLPNIWSLFISIATFVHIKVDLVLEIMHLVTSFD